MSQRSVYQHILEQFADFQSMLTLALLHNLETMHLILRARDWHKDILNPGIAWWMVPVESPEQTEFKTHESWCRQVRSFRTTSEKFMETHFKTYQKEWKQRMEAENGSRTTARGHD